jgi:hypothetical protein
MLLTRFPLGGWQPATPGTPTFWFEADSGITLSSGKVSAWASKVGSYNLANSNSGHRPTYSSTGWNGGALPNITFGSAGAYNVLNYAIGSSLAVSDYTIAARVNVTSKATEQHAIGLTSFANTNEFVYVGITASGGSPANKMFFDFASGGAHQSGTATVTGAAHSLILALDNSQASQYVDGTIDQNSVGISPSATHDTLMVGANDLIGIQPTQFDLVALIGWRGLRFDDATAQQCARYLASRWP